MFHDDLNFDDEFFLREPPIGTECEFCNADNAWCFRHENEAEMTAEAVSEWNELARQRRAKEDGIVDDVRTERLAKLLSVANRLDAVTADVRQLWLSAENDGQKLKILLDRIESAAVCADHCHRSYSREISDVQ